VTVPAPATVPPLPRAREGVALVATALPWPEPWQPRPGARSRTQYWDVETACWQCCPASAVVPEPRRGE